MNAKAENKTAVEELESRSVEEMFFDESLSFDDYIVMKHNVRQLSKEYKALEALIASGRVKRAGKVQLGAAMWMLSNFDEAIKTLHGEKSQLANFIEAQVLIDLKDYDKALALLEKIPSSSEDILRVEIEKARAMRHIGQEEKAIKLLSKLEPKNPDVPDLHYNMGFCLELQHKFDDALERYERALELSGKRHPRAAFRIAYVLDMRGESDEAVRYYQMCGERGAIFVNAVMNLGTLYEDREEYSKAVECYQRVLDIYPTHQRAKLYMKNAKSSMDMYYDDLEKKMAEQNVAVLRIPVTDFELSVRSRNCLAKMNIRNLGDLIKKTEADLLAYKNFGETSLKEIKDMLTSKGLRLGQTLDEDQFKNHEDKAAVSDADAGDVDAPISELKLSIRSRRCVESLGLETIGELVSKSVEDLLSVDNFGQTSLNEIIQKLEEKGLSLRGSE